MKKINTHEDLLKIGNDNKEVSLSLSKYKDCLFIFINQTGAPGSILEGKMTEVAGEVIYEEDQDFGRDQTSPLYEIRVLFGSAEIQFYEVFLRRILSTIWQQLKITDNFKVILNISLPVLSPSFSQQTYYKALTQKLRKSLPECL